MIKLFQKFAEYEAEPHFNAKASAFATVLQKYEALLRIFGQSQYLPKASICALSSRAVCRRRFYKRKKSAAADFHIFIIFSLGFFLGAQNPARC